MFCLALSLASSILACFGFAWANICVICWLRPAIVPAEAMTPQAPKIRWRIAMTRAAVFRFLAMEGPRQVGELGTPPKADRDSNQSGSLSQYRPKQKIQPATPAVRRQSAIC